MDKTVEKTKSLLSSINGRASPIMLHSLRVDCYGTSRSLYEVAEIGVHGPRTLSIRPSDRSMTPEIEKAIYKDNPDMTISATGAGILITLPALTEERCREMVKVSEKEVEQGKTDVRNARKDFNEMLRKLLEEGTPENEVRKAEGVLQQYTDQHGATLDTILTGKTTELISMAQ